MTTAYYNEHDPKAAAWLRELIKQGVITDGEVDERSIEDVIPAELNGFDRCHFFAGIGVWDYALNQAGWPSDRRVWTGSCPCQPFSAAGKGDGFADERHLWPAWFHLIEQCRPRTIFGEQVSSKDTMPWIDLVQTDLEGALYTVGAADLCSPSVGAPHIRQRLYFVADAGHTELSGRKRSTKGIGSVRSEARDESASRGGSSDMADSASVRHDGHAEVGRKTRGRKDKGRVLESPGSGSTRVDGLVDDSENVGCGGSIGETDSGSGNGRGSLSASGTGTSGIVANSDGRGPQGYELQHADLSPGRSEIGILADADGGQREELGQEQDAIRSARNPGPTNGFWRDAEWIYCRDEKYRPVEPGTSPLATGAAARVGRLRGYGNSIVAPLAQAWIESYLDLEK